MVNPSVKQASARLVCLVRGHQKTLLIKQIKLDGATVEGWPNFRVLDSADVCHRCGKPAPR